MGIFRVTRLVFLVVAMVFFSYRVESVPEIPCVYAVRLPNENDFYMDCISVYDGTIQKTFPMTRFPSSPIRIIDRGTTELLCVYDREVEFFRRDITKVNIETGRESEFIQTEGRSPSDIYQIDGHYVVGMDYVKNSLMRQKREPRLAEYHQSGVEIYSATDPITHKVTIHFGEQSSYGPENSKRRPDYAPFDPNLSQDEMFYGCSPDPIHRKLYVLTFPEDLIEDIFPTMNFNEVGVTNLHVIDMDTMRDERTIPLSGYLRDGTHLVVAKDKLYVVALGSFWSDGGVNNPYRYTYMKFPYFVNLAKNMRPEERRLLDTTFPTHESDHGDAVFVFELNPFRLVKIVRAQQNARQICWAPEDNRVFIMHRGWPGSKMGVISCIDTRTDTLIWQKEMHYIHTIAYAGHHRLLISGAKKLVIVDTQTLKIVKELPGYYAGVSQWQGR